MFGQMMKGIAQDFVRYVMHVQVNVSRPTPPAAGARRRAGPVTTGGGDGATPAVATQRRGRAAVQAPAWPRPPAPPVAGGRGRAARGGAPPNRSARAVHQQPVVKSEWDKTPRNAPCPCGSGKKFKLCHGKA
jgi:preprotein translocase subunit SecA